MIVEAVGVLRAGGVVIFPTETVYALACDASNYCARLRIYHLKKRSIKKNLPVMVAGASYLKDIVSLNERQARLIEKYCPGPVTFILPRKNTPNMRFHFPEKIAVRIPDSKIALKILKLFNRPIFATSVNLSGKAAVSDFRQINRHISKRVDYIIWNNQGVRGTASSIVDISGEESRLIRKGAISVTD